MDSATARRMTAGSVWRPEDPCRRHSGTVMLLVAKRSSSNAALQTSLQPLNLVNRLESLCRWDSGTVMLLVTKRSSSNAALQTPVLGQMDGWALDFRPVDGGRQSVPVGPAVSKI